MKELILKIIDMLKELLTLIPGTTPTPSGFTRAKLADIAETEAKKNLKWKPGGCEADKYKEAFFPIFGKAKWSWCAAFGHWCAKQAGLNIPVKCPSEFGYTFALVEGWQQWAIEKGIYHDNNGVFKPERGDIECFDWTQSSINTPDSDWENHFGIHLKMNGEKFVSAEGNTLSSETAIRERSSIQIQGWIRIPDGYKF